MKLAIKMMFRCMGLDIRRFVPEGSSGAVVPGSHKRPIADVKFFLEDVAARGFRPSGIIDVGANRGNWTRMALDVFPTAEIILIEPQDEMEECLQSLCRENDRLHFVKAGAGKQRGELVQTIWDDLDGSSFLPQVDEAQLLAGRQRRTQVVTIDETIRNFQGFSPDLVKLDIQGFEIEALRGAESLFGKTELFILETSLYRFLDGQPTSKDCICFMAEHGYDLYDVTEFMRRPYDGALGQVDLAFARRNGILRQSNKWDV